MTRTTATGRTEHRRPSIIDRIRAALCRPARTAPTPPPASEPAPSTTAAPPTATAVARLHIATALRTRRVADAVRLATLHVDDTDRRHGPDHPHTAEALEILGQVYVLAGEHQRALACFVSASHHRSRCSVPAAPDAIPGLAELAHTTLTAPVRDHARPAPARSVVAV
ncbi:tetratricopeptide repeat protein [Streptomyces sp. NRRL B-24484]|uniref:tetratricopeptide repeat protein n=1 Tax=Streptomyces sp. NRRL B-24484 TaxID=1463833 RepID=UPI0004C1D1E8|nr:tetratricopeptide repeat protein [Streptomyces sp. NRRL B-24484]